jgi:DNA gyrase subunit A
MQETFGVNMLALVDGEPRVLNLVQVIGYYIDHQKDVIIRRTNSNSPRPKTVPISSKA